LRTLSLPVSVLVANCTLAVGNSIRERLSIPLWFLLALALLHFALSRTALGGPVASA
jgi:hypothetical protein